MKNFLNRFSITELLVYGGIIFAVLVMAADCVTGKIVIESGVMIATSYLPPNTQTVIAYGKETTYGTIQQDEDYRLIVETPTWTGSVKASASAWAHFEKGKSISVSRGIGGVTGIQYFAVTTE